MNTQKTGAFISALRKEKGFTQAVLAEKLNVSNRTVSKWENGDGYPEITLLPEIAQALGVSVDELLAGERAEKPRSEIKVEEVANKDNLNNMFKITYIIALFGVIFAAILGGVTEAYNIWAFDILFYNHWEIMFVALSLVATVLSGLVFTIGVTRLSVAYTKQEIKDIAAKYALRLCAIGAIFPLLFLARIIDCSRYGYYMLPIMVLPVAAVIGTLLYAKKRING
jgi:transcriptional regulator with XRE-family HTH domain